MFDLFLVFGEQVDLLVTGFHVTSLGLVLVFHTGN